MVLAWLAVSAFADERGFEPVRDDAGCHISMRPETHPDRAAMRAECQWPEVDAAGLVALLAQYARYPELVFPITEAKVVREEPGRTLVYQRQSLFGIADREVLLWMRQEPRDGGTAFVWTAAVDEPLTLREGAIRTPRNEGYWWVGPGERGGVAVVHEIALDAGGSIPRWIVNLVRSRSFAKIMSDVRTIAAGGA